MTEASTNKAQPETEKKFELSEAPMVISSYLKDILDLKRGVNTREVIKEIRDKRSLSGANAWMLMCSIVIASIGLSQNSQAVIIGAMLISPLMSPILGIGLSIGINDMQTLRSSLGHFFTAVVIAIVTSYLYFSLTPINDLTSEISSRTEPTFLDIFIAFFGGVAGIISVARKDISVTLPGVAIATALMPPLCVTGYGLATGSWEIAYKSFYLFFLNTFFVALATYFIVRLLRFPYKKYTSKKAFRKNLAIMMIFSLTLAIPSFIIFKGVLNKFNLEKSLNLFYSKCLKDEGSLYLDSKYIDEPNKIIYLKVYGDVINRARKTEYLNCLKTCGIADYDLKIISTSEVKLDDVKIIQENLEEISTQLEKNRSDVEEAGLRISYFENITLDSVEFVQIKNELYGAFPELEEISIARISSATKDSTIYNFPTAIVKWSSPSNNKNDELKNFLKARFNYKEIRIINNKADSS